MAYSAKQIIKEEVIRKPGCSFIVADFEKEFGFMEAQNAFSELVGDTSRAVKVYRRNGKIIKLMYYGEYDVNKGSIINQRTAGNSSSKGKRC